MREVAQEITANVIVSKHKQVSDTIEIIDSDFRFGFRILNSQKQAIDTGFDRLYNVQVK